VTPGVERKAVRYVVRGRVQGVGYRWWCRRLAESLGVSGSVRNTAGGDVEVLASGSPETLDAFERQLRTGPSLARVERVVARPASFAPPGGGFVILT
jgi:acylphosphatase